MPPVDKISTFNFNHKDSKGIVADLLELNPIAVSENEKIDEVDVIIGGPPCQAYSIAGRVRDENGMQDDYRNFLFESYVKMVYHFQPKAFVFENVEGILSAKPGGISIVKRVRQAFEEIGYEITQDLRGNALFDTSYYNVPQKRKRVIIFGVQKNKNSTRINLGYSFINFYCKNS